MSNKLKLTSNFTGKYNSDACFTLGENYGDRLVEVKSGQRVYCGGNNVVKNTENFAFPSIQITEEDSFISPDRFVSKIPRDGENVASHVYNPPVSVLTLQGDTKFKPYTGQQATTMVDFDTNIHPLLECGRYELARNCLPDESIFFPSPGFASLAGFVRVADSPNFSYKSILEGPYISSINDMTIVQNSQKFSSIFIPLINNFSGRTTTLFHLKVTNLQSESVYFPVSIDYYASDTETPLYIISMVLIDGIKYIKIGQDPIHEPLIDESFPSLATDLTYSLCTLSDNTETEDPNFGPLLQIFIDALIEKNGGFFPFVSTVSGGVAPELSPQSLLLSSSQKNYTLEINSQTVNVLVKFDDFFISNDTYYFTRANVYDTDGLEIFFGDFTTETVMLTEATSSRTLQGFVIAKTAADVFSINVQTPVTNFIIDDATGSTFNIVSSNASSELWNNIIIIINSGLATEINCALEPYTYDIAINRNSNVGTITNAINTSCLIYDLTTVAPTRQNTFYFQTSENGDEYKLVLINIEDGTLLMSDQTWHKFKPKKTYTVGKKDPRILDREYMTAPGNQNLKFCDDPSATNLEHVGYIEKQIEHQYGVNLISDSSENINENLYIRYFSRENSGIFIPVFISFSADNIGFLTQCLGFDQYTQNMFRTSTDPEGNFPITSGGAYRRISPFGEFDYGTTSVVNINDIDIYTALTAPNVQQFDIGGKVVNVSQMAILEGPGKPDNYLLIPNLSSSEVRYCPLGGYVTSVSGSRVTPAFGPDNYFESTYNAPISDLYCDYEIINGVLYIRNRFPSKERILNLQVSITGAISTVFPNMNIMEGFIPGRNMVTYKNDNFAIYATPTGSDSIKKGTTNPFFSYTSASGITSLSSFPLADDDIYTPLVDVSSENTIIVNIVVIFTPQTYSNSDTGGRRFTIVNGSLNVPSNWNTDFPILPFYTIDPNIYEYLSAQNSNFSPFFESGGYLYPRIITGGPPVPLQIGTTAIVVQTSEKTFKVSEGVYKYSDTDAQIENPRIIWGFFGAKLISAPTGSTESAEVYTIITGDNYQISRATDVISGAQDGGGSPTPGDAPPGPGPVPSGPGGDPPVQNNEQEARDPFVVLLTELAKTGEGALTRELARVLAKRFRWGNLQL